MSVVQKMSFSIWHFLWLDLTSRQGFTSKQGFVHSQPWEAGVWEGTVLRKNLLSLFYSLKLCGNCDWEVSYRHCCVRTHLGSTAHTSNINIFLDWRSEKTGCVGQRISCTQLKSCHNLLFMCTTYSGTCFTMFTKLTVVLQSALCPSPSHCHWAELTCPPTIHRQHPHPFVALSRPNWSTHQNQKPKWSPTSKGRLFFFFLSHQDEGFRLSSC